MFLNVLQKKPKSLVIKMCYRGTETITTSYTDISSPDCLVTNNSFQLRLKCTFLGPAPVKLRTTLLSEPSGEMRKTLLEPLPATNIKPLRVEVMYT